MTKFRRKDLSSELISRAEPRIISELSFNYLEKSMSAVGTVVFEGAGK
jgi:hypothetical protein